MMQSGSIVLDSRNSSSATSYQKECSAATPRRKFACAWFEQEAGKATVPSLSSLAGSASLDCCSVVQATNTAVTNATRTSTALFENRVNGIGLPFVRAIMLYLTPCPICGYNPPNNGGCHDQAHDDLDGTHRTLH